MKRLLAVGALVFAALMLALSATTATVLADSAAEQYTEPQLPQKPPQTDRSNTGNGSSNQPSGQTGGNGDAGSGSSDPGVPGSSITQSDDGGSAAVPDEPQGSGNGAADRGDDSRKSKGGENKSKGGENKSKGGENSSKERESEAALFGTGGDDDGGSGIWLFVALLLGVPLLAGGGYYLFRRYGHGQGDDETRARVRDALSLDKGR